MISASGLLLLACPGLLQGIQRTVSSSSSQEPVPGADRSRFHRCHIRFADIGVDGGDSDEDDDGDVGQE